MSYKVKITNRHFSNGVETDSNKPYYTSSSTRSQCAIWLKEFAYEELMSYVGHNYTIEEMSNHAFELDVLHDNGDTSNHCFRIVES